MRKLISFKKVAIMVGQHVRVHAQMQILLIQFTFMVALLVKPLLEEYFTTAPSSLLLMSEAIFLEM